MNATATTAEEDRADLEAPQAILRGSGFAAAAPLFAADLDAATDLHDAGQVVAAHGRRLWTEAVRHNGEIADDRPLYWARLTLGARLRTWAPPFTVTAADRAALSSRLELASRGHDDLVFPPDERILRVVVTGFDPFLLDDDVRRSNPSGVGALTLHDATFQVGDRTAVVRTAVFPVRWRDFTGGMVERTLHPHYAPAVGAMAADAVITVSQGGEGRFDLEAHNGAWRGPRADNERLTAPGPVPPADGFPAPEPLPQWTASTLPRQAIIERAAGRFPIHDNTEVTEVPAGAEEPVVRPDGPTPGSRARAGGGGDYLSNEIAYRNTLLRDATERAIPAGHVHTPVLDLGADDPAELTDPAFERDRADIVAQLREIVAASLCGTAEGTTP
ncbi:pyroglutamyl peptidase [Nocardiopsis sediminis]|uniref:Pyroglutamyl peptidase n=1 Tax=Nocardiopsis sediminis TaxID=1778267 RepID=A0ABV8FE65_9ACTN